RRRAPYLIALYGVDVWRRLAWDRRRALHGASVQLAISRTTIERARPFTGVLEHAMLLHLTLEPDTAEARGIVDRGLLERLGSGYVLIVGRMAATERYKGHDELLRALPQVLQQQPEARLVIVGDGDDRARLERAAAELGVSTQVVFTGFVNEATLREVHRRAAIFAMPSTGEGFGLVYLEAMREGVPCVAARDSVAAEVMIDGESGVLVNAGDPASLGAALVRLLADSTLRTRIGAAGRERFESEWSYPRFAQSLDAALDRLTGASNVRN
ncbi:MAG: glycosyltransferase, partial [Acidobacteriota bacterium]